MGFPALEDAAFFKLMDISDQRNLIQIRSRFINKSQNPSFDYCSWVISEIHGFCIIKNPNRVFRCITCGYIPTNIGVAINYRQLRIVTCLNKNVLQQTIQKMGYDLIRTKITDMNDVSSDFQWFKNNPSEIKQWVNYQFMPRSFRPAMTMMDSEMPVRTMSLEDVSNIFDDPFSLPPAFLYNDLKSNEPM